MLAIHHADCGYMYNIVNDTREATNNWREERHVKKKPRISNPAAALVDWAVHWGAVACGL